MTPPLTPEDRARLRCGWKRPIHMLQRALFPMGTSVLRIVREFPDIDFRWRMYRNYFDRPYLNCPCGRASNPLLADVFREDA